MPAAAHPLSPLLKTASVSRTLGRFRLHASTMAAAFAFLFLTLPHCHAAAVGSVPPTPDVRPNPALPMRPVESSPLPFPGLLSNSAQIQDQVHPLFPQDGAIFPDLSVVTLGWMLPDKWVLPDEARIVPDSFEVVVTSDTIPPVAIKKVYPVTMKQTTYHGLINVPLPGRYQWQVAAVMASGQRIKAPNRVFTVLPK